LLDTEFNTKYQHGKNVKGEKKAIHQFPTNNFPVKNFPQKQTSPKPKKKKKKLQKLIQSLNIPHHMINQSPILKTSLSDFLEGECAREEEAKGRVRKRLKKCKVA
jgi:hypothetical protein